MADGTNDNEQEIAGAETVAAGESGKSEGEVGSAGKIDEATTRYIPMGGGSRSRLKTHDETIPRYQGFVGVEGSQDEKIATIKALYSKLGGGTRITSQDRAWVDKTLADDED